MQLEALNEISKFAAIKAVNALSKLLSEPTGMDFQTKKIEKFDQINFILPEYDEIVGLDIQLTGSISGITFLIFSESAAFEVCDKLLGEKNHDTKQFSETEISALEEVFNVVIGNFLSSLATSLKINALMHRAPHFSHSTYASFIKKISSTVSSNIPEGIILEITFQFQCANITGTFIMLLSENEVDASMNKVVD